MRKIITSYIGLDIHKDSIAITVAKVGRKTPEFIGTINPIPSSLLKALRRITDDAHMHIVYEAGPCGYSWVRYLRWHGIDCEVIAPARIARSPAEKRVTNNRRGALLLAREHRAGNLTR